MEHTHSQKSTAEIVTYAAIAIVISCVILAVVFFVKSST